MGIGGVGSATKSKDKYLACALVSILATVIIVIIVVLEFKGDRTGTPPDPYDANKILIQAEQLKSMMDAGEKNLQILEAVYNPPSSEGVMQDQAQVQASDSFIPTARELELLPMNDPSKNYSLSMPTQEEFLSIALRMDLRLNDTFILYDSGTVHPANRLAWTLKYFGAKHVHVLNGTLLEWVKQGYEVSKEMGTGPTREGDPSETAYDFKADPELVYTFERVKTISDDNVAGINMVPLLDARGKEQGYDKGHIPSAQSMPQALLLNEDKTYKSEQELLEIVKTHTDIINPSDEHIVVYCQIGLSASTLCVGLAALGNNKISLYDGSYADWSSRMG